MTRSLAGVLSAISVALLLSGCIACGGQCSAPYELDVTFHLGTTRQVAKTVFNTCGHNPIVTRIGKPQVVDGLMTGRLWTEYFERTSMTEPLLKCLDRSPSVTDAGWPD